MAVETDPNTSIRTYIENDGAANWQFKETAQDLYSLADVFRFYFFGQKEETQKAIPNLVLAFPPMQVNALAAYRLVPNALGLSYEISLNALYLHRPKWEIYESLLHEMTHLYQENTPGLTPCQHNYHNVEFVSICEDMGLHPRVGSGAHWRPANGQFARLMERYSVVEPNYGVVVPKDTPKVSWWDADRGPRKGTSTLVLYVCESCMKDQPCKLRSGKKDLEIKCKTCGGDFKPQL